MKVVYCANCGKRLNVKRKALPMYGKIIDIVEYHECPDEPYEIDLTPVDIPKFDEVEGRNKFVQNLNNLSPKPEGSSPLLSNEPGDKRFEKPATTTAPQSLLDQIKNFSHSTPEHSLED